MNTQLVILGAGGHGRVILDACQQAGIPVGGFIDNGKAAGSLIHGVPVLGDDGLLDDTGFCSDYRFIIGVGDTAIRRQLIERADGAGVCLATVIHPSAIVSPCSTVGAGTLINAGAVVNIDALIGRHCILNTRCSVDHDCRLGDNVHVCPGATLAGGVVCGTDAYIGSGATVLPNRRIGDRAVIGAGTTVIKDISADTTFVGPLGRLVDRPEP